MLTATSCWYFALCTQRAKRVCKKQPESLPCPRKPHGGQTKKFKAEFGEFSISETIALCVILFTLSMISFTTGSLKYMYQKPVRFISFSTQTSFSSFSLLFISFLFLFFLVFCLFLSPSLSPSSSCLPCLLPPPLPLSPLLLSLFFPSSSPST